MYRVVGETFGVSKTTVQGYACAVCLTIPEKMCSYTTLPGIAEAQEISNRNSIAHQVPQVYCALVGAHTPILTGLGIPGLCECKDWPSIVLQVVVDDQCLIRDIWVGSPGSAHDEAVLITSGSPRDVPILQSTWRESSYLCCWL